MSFEWPFSWNTQTQLSVLFLVLSAMAMKVTSFVLRREGRGAWRFFFSPCLSFKTYRDSEKPNLSVLSYAALQLLVRVLFVVVAYEIYRRLASLAPPHSVVLAYYAILPFVAVIYAIVMPLRFAGLLSGSLAPDIHRAPWEAENPTEFWGYRWNRWVHEWFFEVLFFPFREAPQKALFLVFFFSGLWHEYLINLPFALAERRFFFGNMMIYFMIQYASVALVRTQFAPRSLEARFITWGSVLGPAPLFFAEPTLKLLGL